MSDTDEIKSRLSIVDVISPYVKLVKAGKYHKGLCPFHKEKSPSFMVSPDRGVYHCFGCGKGGDIFSFIQEVERVDFRGALQILADKAGVAITEDRGGVSKDFKDSLFATLKDAEQFFIETLAKTPSAREYLHERGLKDETLERFSVGYAPSSAGGNWRLLFEHLEQIGHAETVIEQAGLVKYPEAKEGEGKSDARPYDRFRGRIMFPIHDTSGRTVAFSGRIFEDDPKHPQAKYVNSPETAVFHKSRILHGLDIARGGITKYGFAILVEGQVDLLMAHQMGFVNTVALSGTSFTEEHAALLKRYTENLLIAFDGDAAGVSASGRAAALALKAGLNTKIAPLPPGEDPADVIKKNPDTFKAAIRGGVHVVDFYMHILRDSGYGAREFKLEVSRVVLPYIRLIANAIDREYFIGRVAKVLEVPDEAVRQELGKLETGTRVEKSASVLKPSIMHTPEPFLSRSDTIEKLLLGLLTIFEEQKDEERYARIKDALMWLGEAGIRERLGTVEEIRVATIEADIYLEQYPTEEAKDAMVDELVADYAKERTRIAYREATQRVRKAEAEGDIQAAEEALAAVALLAKRL